MTNPAWIVNAEPGDGPVPDKAIDIVLYGAGSGGGDTTEMQAAIDELYQIVNVQNGILVDFNSRISALENDGGAGTGAN